MKSVEQKKPPIFQSVEQKKTPIFFKKVDPDQKMRKKSKFFFDPQNR